MPSQLIPLFPLHVVVFPRTSLPLHIFEERYKELVGQAIRENSEFGVVLAKDEGIVNAGCTVVVEKVLQLYPDGRMDIRTRGRKRFEIVELNQEKAFLQAEVNFFEDDDFTEPPPELRDQVMERYEAVRQFASSHEQNAPDMADPQLSFQLAQILPDLDFLNSLLRRRSEASRLSQLNDYLAQYIPRQRTVERVKAAAPTNGFGGKHPEA